MAALTTFRRWRPRLPRYDYQCLSCEHEFELTQSFSEAGSGVCPICSGVGRRVFHAVPVIYKGSGFYTTDYGRLKSPPEDKGKASKDGKDSKDSQTTSDKGSSSTSETKAETKTESPSKATSEAKT